MTDFFLSSRCSLHAVFFFFCYQMFLVFLFLMCIQFFCSMHLVTFQSLSPFLLWFYFTLQNYSALQQQSQWILCQIYRLLNLLWSASLRIHWLVLLPFARLDWFFMNLFPTSACIIHLDFCVDTILSWAFLLRDEWYITPQQDSAWI